MYHEPGTPLRLLALDTSSTCVGWAVFDEGEYYKSGRFVQVGSDHGEKMHNFRLWLLQKFREFEPTQVAVEMPFMRYGRQKTFAILIQYIAVLREAHFSYFERELPPANCLSAKAIKDCIGVERGEDHEDNKRIMVKEINARYGLRLKYKENDKTKRVSQDDEADAIAVAETWMTKYRRHAPSEEAEPEEE